MKLSYLGRVRKVKNFPASIAELQKHVIRKFTEKNDNEMSLAQSSLMDESQVSEFLVSQSFSKGKKRVPTVNWAEVTCFFEDSEGDFCVISEDDDLSDAQIFKQEKEHEHLECTLLPKELFR